MNEEGEASARRMLRDMADQIGWRDVIAGMTTRQMVDEFGISRANAWRAKTGRTHLPRFIDTEAFRNRRAAEAFRQAGPNVNVGRREVFEKSPGRRSTRSIGTVTLANPEYIARQIERGNYTGPGGAAGALDAQIMAAYGNEAQHALELTNYEGVTFT